MIIACRSRYSKYTCEQVEIPALKQQQLFQGDASGSTELLHMAVDSHNQQH